MRKLFGILMILLLAATPVSFAAESYADATSSKLQGGLTNTLLGWSKLVSVPYNYQQENKNPWAGVGKGLVDAIVCTVGGAFNLVTFPIPGEMALPDGGVSLAG